jgi:hypothetical protein
MHLQDSLYLEERDLSGDLEEVSEDALDPGLQDVSAEVWFSHHIQLLEGKINS